MELSKKDLQKIKRAIHASSQIAVRAEKQNNNLQVAIEALKHITHSQPIVLGTVGISEKERQIISKMITSLEKLQIGAYDVKNEQSKTLESVLQEED